MQNDHWIPSCRWLLRYMYGRNGIGWDNIYGWFERKTDVELIDCFMFFFELLMTCTPRDPDVMIDLKGIRSLFHPLLLLFRLPYLIYCELVVNWDERSGCDDDNDIYLTFALPQVQVTYLLLYFSSRSSFPVVKALRSFQEPAYVHMPFCSSIHLESPPSFRLTPGKGWVWNINVALAKLEAEKVPT